MLQTVWEPDANQKRAGWRAICRERNAVLGLDDAEFFEWPVPFKVFEVDGPFSVRDAAGLRVASFTLQKTAGHPHWYPPELRGRFNADVLDPRVHAVVAGVMEAVNR